MIKLIIPAYMLIFLGALIPLGSAATADTPALAEQAQTGPISIGLRVFTCGHSFHAWVAPYILEMAESANLKGAAIAGVSSIGGSPALAHFTVSATNATHHAKAAVIEGNIDVLTLSCMSGPDEGVEKFAKLGFAHNPHIRVMVQELWLPQDRFPFIPAIKTTTNDWNKTTLDQVKQATEAYFKAMEDYVTTLNKSLGKQVVFVVPDAQAVLALREKVIAGAVPGIKKQSDLFSDAWGHPRSAVQLLSGYCHYAVIYRRSPVGLPLIKCSAVKDEALNRLLQEIAWDAVTHHPLTGVTAN